MNIIDVTYINADVFFDGWGCSFFVVSGFPEDNQKLSKFWEDITKAPIDPESNEGMFDCFNMEEESSFKDGRPRVGIECYNKKSFDAVKNRLIETVKRLVPEAKVRYHQFGPISFVPEWSYGDNNDYDEDEELAFLSAFTEDEQSLPRDLKRTILGLN